jgi:DNA-directed RNA polymerase I subunit RPA1
MLIKLQLLEMGEITNANELDDLVHQQILLEDKSEEVSHINDVEGQLKVYEERFRAFMRMPSRPRIDPYHKTLQSKVIESFIKQSMGARKCENCNSFSPKYRKDGYSKIFQKPLSSRMMKPNKAMRLELKVSSRHLSSTIAVTLMMVVIVEWIRSVKSGGKGWSG